MPGERREAGSKGTVHAPPPHPARGNRQSASPVTPPLGIGNREWGIVGMGNGEWGGRFPAFDEIGVGWEGADCLIDSPFPIADSQGRGRSAGMFADSQGEGGGGDASRSRATRGASRGDNTAQPLMTPVASSGAALCCPPRELVPRHRRYATRFMPACGATSLTTLAADRRHMTAILADHLATLPSRFARLVRREFMRRALCMGRTATLARDLALPHGIHGRESPIAPSVRVAGHRSKLPRVGSCRAGVACTAGDGSPPSGACASPPVTNQACNTCSSTLYGTQ